MSPGPRREGHKPPGLVAEKGVSPGGGSPPGRAPLPRTKSVSQIRSPEGRPLDTCGDLRPYRQLSPGQEAPVRQTMSAPPWHPMMLNVYFGGQCVAEH